MALEVVQLEFALAFDLQTLAPHPLPRSILVHTFVLTPKECRPERVRPINLPCLYTASHTMSGLVYYYYFLGITISRPPYLAYEIR